MPLSRKEKISLVLTTVVVMALASILLINFYPQQRSINHKLSLGYDVKDPQFFRAMGNLLGPPIDSGNKVTALYNGVEIFPAMLDAIKSAKKTITFETYIYWSGNIAQKFVDALTERSKAGVKIHVLLDWVGSQPMDEKHVENLRDAGIQVEFYHPLKWYNISRLNYRTHRKFLVIDGKVGFTGGVGIGDSWDGNADTPKLWRESHFKVEGPVALHMQAAFMDNWLKVRPEVLHDETYFPKVEPVGKSPAQVFMSSAEEGTASVHLMYMMAIAAAKKSIMLSSAYFVPDEVAVQELIAAKERGVKVQIIVPGPYGDADVVKSASRALWGELLAAGVEIYEYLPSMFHCKVLVVDNYFVSVGSTNFDDRSFRLNDEANLNIFDEEFALKEAETFKKDLQNSRLVTYDMWKKRPFKEKLMEFFSLYLRSQL